MPWRELLLSSIVVVPGCSHREPECDEVPRVFTTAKLGWRPLVSDDPDGPQVATLWGDPLQGSFGAVVQFPMSPPETYTLIRRENQRCSCRAEEARRSAVIAR